ncbi:MAG: thiol-disulfide oxidoreductase DCC family protein [Saprospiraceae bacterium]
MDTAQQTNTPILLFDGVCNLCNASVQWVLKRDRRGLFRFAALQSEAGKQLLARSGLNDAQFDSVVLLIDGQALTRSDAAFGILRMLGAPWSWLAVLCWLPKSWRDAIYEWVARNRYRWFGRQEKCLLPKPEWRQRFM